MYLIVVSVALLTIETDLNEDIRGRQVTMNLELFILPEYIVQYVTLFSIPAMLQEKNTSCFTHPLTEYIDEFLTEFKKWG